MKQLFLTAVLIIGTVASSRADVLTPIDPHRKADVSGQGVDLPTVNLNTLAQPWVAPQAIVPVSGQTAPVSGKRTERGRVIDNKTVELQTLDFSTVPMKTVPRSNFEPKRAALPNSPVSAPSVPKKPADIEHRVITPTTPAGAEELKDQLKTLR